ncbi:MAG: photosystem I reaction center subunit PsaK [Okeania sp. SIO2H7]|nr:photosystem I reaction center subunit PsaK [Okeania sp. SIO2H7]
MYSTLLATTVPHTPEWSPLVGLVMIICNIIAIAFAKATVQYQSVGPMPPSPGLFGGFSIPMILAATSFGHILGAGTILGLGALGVL